MQAASLDMAHPRATLRHMGACVRDGPSERPALEAFVEFEEPRPGGTVDCKSLQPWLASGKGAGVSRHLGVMRQSRNTVFLSITIVTAYRERPACLGFQP